MLYKCTIQIIAQNSLLKYIRIKDYETQVIFVPADVILDDNLETRADHPIQATRAAVKEALRSAAESAVVSWGEGWEY